MYLDSGKEVPSRNSLNVFAWTDRRTDLTEIITPLPFARMVKMHVI